MKRLRILLRGSGVVAAIALVAIGSGVRADHRHRSGRFDLIEATIPSIQQAIHDRIITPEQLVRMYLNRIAAYDAKTTAAHLNSYIHVNQDAVRGTRRTRSAVRSTTDVPCSRPADRARARASLLRRIWRPSASAPKLRDRF